MVAAGGSPTRPGRTASNPVSIATRRFMRAAALADKFGRGNIRFKEICASTRELWLNALTLCKCKAGQAQRALYFTDRLVAGTFDGKCSITSFHGMRRLDHDRAI